MYFGGVRAILFFAASLAIGACVTSSTVSPGAVEGPQGQLGGACFPNGKCNAGLECGLVDGGVAECVPEGNATTTASSGSVSSSGAVADGAAPADGGREASPDECTVTPAAFPCGGDNPPTACYGAAQSCTLTGCNVGDLMWSCNVPQTCGKGIACCVPAATATAKPGASCAMGILELAADQAQGAICGAGPACAGGATQLCATTADCPAAQRCTPVKITGGGAAINGNTVGVCAP